MCVTRFDQSESAFQTIASPKKKRLFALARVEDFVCVTAFAIGFWKLFSGGSLGKYCNIGSGSVFFNLFRYICCKPVLRRRPRGIRHVFVNCVFTRFRRACVALCCSYWSFRLNRKKD